MKHLILTIGLCLSTHFIFASQIMVEPQQDSIPASKWSKGVQIGFMTEGRFTRSYQLGMFSEYRFNSLFAIEAEFLGEYKDIGYGFFGGADWSQFNLDFSVSAKMYFGKYKKWFGKFGYYRNYNLTNSLNDHLMVDYPFRRPIRSNLRLSMGYNFDLKNGSVLKLEGMIGDESHNSLIGGFKLGITF